MMADVAVVVVNYNAGDALAATVGSISSSGSGRLAEVIVVDNASSDGSLEALAGMAGVRVIANDRNLGLAAANNQGIAASSTPYVLLSNPDVTYGAGTIDAVAGCFDRHPAAAIVGARLEGADGVVQTTVGDLPRLGGALFGRLAYGRSWWTDWPHDTERSVGHVSEACYAVRRAALEEVGPLDPAYFLSWEGADLAARVNAAGWEVWFCPEARAVHTGGVTLGRQKARWILTSHRGAYRYFRLHSRVPRPVLAGLFSARAMLKVAWGLVGSPPTHVTPVRR
jgi:N-acetylglucosaminyl-diphospho-decaprenol L-rhamnosyltransferase